MFGELCSYQEVGQVLHPVHQALQGPQRRQVDADLQRRSKVSIRVVLKVILQRDHRPRAYVEVGHAGLLELVPQSARDDVHRDVVSDNPAEAGQSRLDRTKTSVSETGRLPPPPEPPVCPGWNSRPSSQTCPDSPAQQRQSDRDSVSSSASL